MDRVVDRVVDRGENLENFITIRFFQHGKLASCKLQACVDPPRSESSLSIQYPPRPAVELGWAARIV